MKTLHNQRGMQAGINVVDTPLVHDAMELTRNSSQLYLYNHVMRSWLFAVPMAAGAKPAQRPGVLAQALALQQVPGVRGAHHLGFIDEPSFHAQPFPVAYRRSP
jgi:hypothetical protein